MTNNAPRSDAENKRKLDQLMPVYDDLRSLKIRAEADQERADSDVETTREEAKQFFGTDDPASIDKMIADQRAGNTTDIDDFETRLNDIRQKLAEIEEPAR